MFRLIPTMRRGSASALPQAAARYPSIKDARLGAAELVRNEFPGGFVEWIDR